MVKKRAKRTQRQVQMDWEKPLRDDPGGGPAYQRLLDFWHARVPRWAIEKKKPKNFKKHRKEFCRRHPYITYTVFDRQVGPLRSDGVRQTSQGFAERNRDYWLAIGGWLPPVKYPERKKEAERIDASRVTHAVKSIRSTLMLLTDGEAEQVHVAMRNWQNA